MSSAIAASVETIPVNERLIVALDVQDAAAAKALVEQLGDSVSYYKIGLELAATRDYFPLLDWLTARGKRVFADLKLFDIPATVAAAVRQMSQSGASFLTVHADRGVLEAAAEHKGADLQILAVTVLTSSNRDDLEASGISLDVKTLVLKRAQLAIDCGCDGVIASGLEAGPLRQQLGNRGLIVTPGIRPADHAGGDDQKRIVTPRDAFKSGADHIVVGRPIRAAADPKAAALSMQREIAAVFE